MALQDIEEFFDPTLALPIKGKVYVIQPPDAALGVKLQRLFTVATSSALGDSISPEDIASLELDDEQEKQTYAMVLGDAYAEMLADKVPWPYLKHAGSTAMIWIGLSREAAEAFWGTASGEARRPEPQDHKAPAKKTASRPRKKAAASPASLASSNESQSADPLETPAPS